MTFGQWICSSNNEFSKQFITSVLATLSFNLKYPMRIEKNCTFTISSLISKLVRLLSLKSSLAKLMEDEGSYLPNCQPNLVIVLLTLARLGIS